MKKSCSANPFVPQLLQFIFCFFFIICFWSTANADTWSDKYPIKKDIPGTYSYESISQKDYHGVTINILTHAKPVMGEPTELHAKQFEELTGATVKVHHVSWGELYEAVLWGLKQNEYDIVIGSSLWLADIAEYVEPLPQKMVNSDQFQDVIDYYKDISKHGDKYYQVPIDGDRHYLQYRTDLLNDKNFRKKFKEKHHKNLEVPKTWKELNEIAEFFNKTQLSDGTTVYGAAEVTKWEDLLFSYFCKRSTSYAKHPDVHGGFYFDLKTMKPLINNPGFVEALKDFAATSKFYPPGGDKFGLWDVIQSFGGGQAVFSDSWDDAFIQAMETDSPIRNQVAASISPGSRKVWNRVSQQWDDFPEINQVPYLAGGWTSSVAKSSKNKEAAFDFLGFFGNEANHASDLLVGRYGVNPYRYTDLDKKFWVEHAGWDENVAESYVETFHQIDQARHKIPDLRILQARQYVKALAIGVSRSLTGRSTPQEALDWVASEWEKLTEKIGRDKQRQAYAHLVKVEDMDKWAQKFPIERDWRGPYSYEEISQKDYRGVTLNVISHEPPNLGEAVAIHAAQFEELTGAKVNVRFVIYKNLYSELMWGLKRGSYDVVCYGGEWLADIGSYLEPLPEKMLNSSEYQNISRPYKKMAMWNGRPVEVKIDGDKHYLQYRTDLFANKGFRAEFKNRYGRQLVPPKTWKDYRQVAAFFNSRVVDGKIIYGATEITKKTDLVYSQFFKRAGAYAKHPEVKGGYYFDLETMQPLINTPGFVEALKDFVAIQEYLPPGGNNFGLVEALQSFGRGDAVLSDMWDDAFISATERGNPIRDKVAASISPGSKRVWNRKSGKWDEFPDINYAPYLPESWASGVPSTSKNKQAAFDFLGFFRNRANHQADMLVGRRGINPFYNSCADKSFWVEKAGWSDEVASSYMETLEIFTNGKNHVFALNIIEGRRYLVALTEGIHHALNGRKTPQVALDDVAQKWIELTERIGISKQREAYANIVKLEDSE